LSSNYNSRPRVCELLVDKNKVIVAREREAYGELWSQELSGLKAVKGKPV
jgi:diaminopimelate decarboxylase